MPHDTLLVQDDIEYIEPLKNGPVREYVTYIERSGGKYTNRLMVGTATTGVIRFEWHAARSNQIIPMNWSYVSVAHTISSYVPLGYLVPDAQNLIVKEAIDKNMEWLLLYEHDILPPPDAFSRLDKYIREEKTPVVSGLYFTRSVPSDPLVFRGRGTGVYDKWEMGDLVWCDGVPTGFLLIHMGILREMWNDSEEYILNNIPVRKVFETPTGQWFDPEQGLYTATGTSDLNWCSKVMEGDYFKKVGWDDYHEKKYPFLIDTNIFCRHIDLDGRQFP